jgi:hypothetical protein
MTSAADIEDRVRAQDERGAFLGQMLSLSRQQSADLHEDFIRKLSTVATNLRRLFENEGLLRRFEHTSRSYWEAVRGRKICFVDGGVARIDIPSSAPMGIRVGTYTVRLGDDSADREAFNTALTLVDDLYSQSAWTFEDAFDDTQKLTDAARIIGEASAALKQVEEDTGIDAIYLHGPLINPVAPYGTPGFPSFTEQAASILLSAHDATTQRERHFVVLYREILERLAKSGRPCFGVVERSISNRPSVVYAHLDAMQERNTLSPDDAHAIRTELETYRLSDPTLFGVLLAEGELCEPVAVRRQEPRNKWPQEWYTEIKVYPDPSTTYIKSSETAEPFRVESHQNGASEWALEMVYHTARLLPNYGFPVGLDIVDKFAKVPNWMSRNVRREHAAALLRNALRSGDPKMVEYAKKVLTARGRDWLFRPKA